MSREGGGGEGGEQFLKLSFVSPRTLQLLDFNNFLAQHTYQRDLSFDVYFFKIDSGSGELQWFFFLEKLQSAWPSI